MSEVSVDVSQHARAQQAFPEVLEPFSLEEVNVLFAESKTLTEDNVIRLLLWLREQTNITTWIAETMDNQISRWYSSLAEKPDYPPYLEETLEYLHPLEEREAITLCDLLFVEYEVKGDVQGGYALNAAFINRLVRDYGINVHISFETIQVRDEHATDICLSVGDFILEV